MDARNEWDEINRRLRLAYYEHVKSIVERQSLEYWVSDRFFQRESAKMEPPIQVDMEI